MRTCALLTEESGAIELLNEFQVDMVACDLRQERLILQLTSSSEWGLLFGDDVGQVYVRSTIQENLVEANRGEILQ